MNIPNPFTNKLVAEISSSDAQLIQVQLIDQSGRVIRKEQFALNAGFNSIQLATESLPKGLYTLQVSAGEGQLSKKVLKN